MMEIGKIWRILRSKHKYPKYDPTYYDGYYWYTVDHRTTFKSKNWTKYNVFYVLVGTQGVRKGYAITRWEYYRSSKLVPYTGTQFYYAVLDNGRFKKTFELYWLSKFNVERRFVITGSLEMIKNTRFFDLPKYVKRFIKNEIIEEQFCDL